MEGSVKEKRIDKLEKDIQKHTVALCFLLNELRAIDKIPRNTLEMIEKILTK